MDSGNVVTPWAFRDGREYIVSLSVNEKPKSVSILIKDKITAEEWSCQYDLKYIEDLTQRTGSFKQFDVFVLMIKGAILKNTDSVTLELLSLEDLKLLKNKRHCKGLVATNESNRGHLNNLGSQDHNGVQNSASTKKYLIVTYTSEFDTVHYPIALNYSGPPDPIIMQNTIRRLMGEVSHLRTANVELSSQLKPGPKESQIQTDCSKSYLRRHSSGFGLLGDYDVDESKAKKVGDLGQTPGHSCDPQQSEYRFDLQSMQKLLCSIHQLEEKIVRERVHHMGEMDKLMQENNYLQKKLDKLQNSELELKQRLERLEGAFTRSDRREAAAGFRNSIDVSKARDRNNNIKNPGPGVQRYPLRRSSSTTADSGSNGGRHAFQARPRASSVGSAEPIRVERQTAHGRRSFQPDVITTKKSTLRSRSVSPARFDPTAYIRDRKDREDKIRQLRMSKIESRFRAEENIRGRARRRRNDRSEDEQTSTSVDVVSANGHTLTSLENRERARERGFARYDDRAPRPRPRPRQITSISPVIGRSTRVTYSRSPRSKFRTEDSSRIRDSAERRRPVQATVSTSSATTDLHLDENISTNPRRRDSNSNRFNVLRHHEVEAKVSKKRTKKIGRVSLSVAPEDYQPPSKPGASQKTSVEELAGPLKAIQAFIDTTKATLLNTVD